MIISDIIVVSDTIAIIIKSLVEKNGGVGEMVIVDVAVGVIVGVTGVVDVAVGVTGGVGVWVGVGGVSKAMITMEVVSVFVSPTDAPLA